jgi:hypothetical protein
VLHCLSAPSPPGYGWTIEATDLDIKWGPMESAPDSILEITSCNVQVQERLQHQEVLMKESGKAGFWWK